MTITAQTKQKLDLSVCVFAIEADGAYTAVGNRQVQLGAWAQTAVVH